MATPNVKFYYVNEWIGDSVTLTSSSEAINYPDTNTQTRQRTKRWRSTDVSAEWIKIAGTSIPADGAFIFGHNLTSGATVKVEANATDAWGAPSVSETMTRTTIDRQNQYVKIFGSTQTYNYWRFTFADAGNTDGYISIGVPWLGEMDYEPANGLANTAGPIFFDNSTVNIGDGGQVFGVARTMARGLNMPFQMITERQDFEDFVSAAGITKPFVAQLTPFDSSSYTSPEDWSYYMRFMGMPTINGINQEFWTANMQAIEEL